MKPCIVQVGGVMKPMMYFMISNPGMGRLSTVQVGVLEPNAFFLISRDGTIVQVGGVMEPHSLSQMVFFRSVILAINQHF